MKIYFMINLIIIIWYHTSVFIFFIYMFGQSKDRLTPGLWELHTFWDGVSTKKINLMVQNLAREPVVYILAIYILFNFLILTMWWPKYTIPDEAT